MSRCHRIEDFRCQSIAYYTAQSEWLRYQNMPTWRILLTLEVSCRLIVKVFSRPPFNLHVGGCSWRNPSNFAHLTPGRTISVLLGVQNCCSNKANPIERQRLKATGLEKSSPDPCCHSYAVQEIEERTARPERRRNDQFFDPTIRYCIEISSSLDH